MEGWSFLKERKTGGLYGEVDLAGWIPSTSTSDTLSVPSMSERTDSFDLRNTLIVISLSSKKYDVVRSPPLISYAHLTANRHPRNAL